MPLQYLFTISSPHTHFSIFRQILQSGRWQRLIPVRYTRIIIITRACPSHIVDRHAETGVKVDRIRHMETVQKEPLLTVIELPVVAQNRIKSAVMPAEGLIIPDLYIISKSNYL